MRSSTSPPRHLRRGLASFAGLSLAALLATQQGPAHAVSIELNDVAPERVENQRRSATTADPLPGTPDLAAFDSRLEAAGLKLGNPILIRLFKAEAQAELWMRKDDRYVLFATYPVCNWSGTVGPKLAEGDKQTPEGFYTVTRRQLHRIGRWPRSLNLGFPNVYDQSLARTGSYILMHGGCSSVGCFAMTNPVISEIYRLTQAAIVRGQDNVPVHVFPFRLTQENLAKHDKSNWASFWRNLKEGYDAFEETRNPPNVRVCQSRYEFDRVAPGEGGLPSPLAPCGETIAAVQALEEFYSLARRDPLLRQINHQTREQIWRQASSSVPPHLGQAFDSYREAMTTLAREMLENEKLPPARRKHPRLLAQTAVNVSQSRCSSKLASCRRFIALAEQRLKREVAASREAARRRMKTAKKEPHGRSTHR